MPPSLEDGPFRWLGVEGVEEVAPLNRTHGATELRADLPREQSDEGRIRHA